MNSNLLTLNAEMVESLIPLFDYMGVSYSMVGNLLTLYYTPPAVELFCHVLYHYPIPSVPDDEYYDTLALYRLTQYLDDYAYDFERYTAIHFSQPFTRDVASYLAHNVVWVGGKEYAVFPHNDLVLLLVIDLFRA